MIAFGAHRGWVTGILVGIPLLVPGVAAAQTTIGAKPTDAFDAASYTIDQGGTVVFRNGDIFNSHNVESDGNGPDGKALFTSEIIPPGQTTPVTGTQFLTTGSYGFICAVHPSMKATLVVTTAGTPVPRPADTSAPAVRLRIRRGDLDAIARNKRLGVRVTVSEAAAISLRAKARIGSRRVALGRRSFTFSAAATRTVRIRLGRRARRALAGASRARLTVTGTARDGAGNIGRATGRATLRG